MYKVLIVEDDPMVAMINEQYVLKHGKFKVVGKCQDGAKAIEFLAKNEADLVVMDVFMPKTDGFETLRRLRRDGKTIEAIMVTAANDRASIEEGLRLGVLDYLVKPFTFERFKVALDKFIAQKQTLRELDTLNQSNIDFIINQTRFRTTDSLPKGIQEQTLGVILDCLSCGEILTSEVISERTGLTAVTVRRYMSYLEGIGKVCGELNYETGGRPCMYYKIRK